MKALSEICILSLRTKSREISDILETLFKQDPYSTDERHINIIMDSTIKKLKTLIRF